MLGRKGGPFADMAAPVGENRGVARVAIEYDIHEGAGRFRIEGVLEAVMRPYRGPSGAVTTLNETIFSTIPGSPAYVGKAIAVAERSMPRTWPSPTRRRPLAPPPRVRSRCTRMPGRSARASTRAARRGESVMVCAAGATTFRTGDVP